MDFFYRIGYTYHVHDRIKPQTNIKGLNKAFILSDPADY